MRKKLLSILLIVLCMLFTGCSEQKETKIEFKNLGEFIENIQEWDYEETNLKNTDFKRYEDDDYNVWYDNTIKINNHELTCYYEFCDEKLNSVLLVIPQLNQSDEEMIEISKWVLKQANQYCKLNVQETTNAAIEDYVGTMYYFRINNDVDPMNTIEENIKDNVEGADFSCLYKSKNGEFKDMKLQFEQTGEESDSTYINMIFSNTKNEIYPYSEE